jgi:hypothetical protein
MKTSTRGTSSRPSDITFRLVPRRGVCDITRNARLKGYTRRIVGAEGKWQFQCECSRHHNNSPSHQSDTPDTQRLNPRSGRGQRESTCHKPKCDVTR